MVESPEARALREEQKRHRIALDAAELGTWRHDLRTGVFQLDERGQAHYGVSRFALPIDDVSARVHPEDRERLAREMAEVLGSPGRDAFYTEYRTFSSDGRIQYLRVHVRVEFEGEGDHRRAVVGYGTTQDVTSARQTERMLLEQALLLKQVEEIAHIGGWDFEIDSGKGHWTAETLRIHGLDAMPQDASSGLDRFEGEARTTMAAALDAAITRGVPYDLELPFTSADGRHKWVRASCRPVQTRGRVTRLRGTLQDITDRKESELALRRFMESSPTILYALAVEPDGQRLLRLEGDLERLTGWSRADANASTWWLGNIHPDDRERVLAQNPTPYDIDRLSIEFRFRRADGTYLWLHDERRLLRDSEGRPSEVVGAWSDVTERIELETQLRQSQKLEAIGQLAGGIAHDFNNLLTVIIGTSELLGASLAPHATALGFVDDIRAAGERAATLTRQLLAFSRKQVLQPMPVHVNDAIEGMDRLLRRLIGEHITVVTELQPDAGHAVVDPGQFEQVLVNLAVNARDAMPRGGTLTIRTGIADAADLAGFSDRRAGRHVAIAISDTGCGMSPEIQSRIFEPFFTTKPVGRGTGLGLATVFGIVKQSGGQIAVQSAPDRGTSFTLYLPWVTPTALPAPSAHAAHPGSETVLLVDDEEGVRRVTALALSRSGYRVLEAASPREALTLASDGSATIDLLITDVVMPGLAGPELAAILTSGRPHLKVLFISGYVDADLEPRHPDGLRHPLLMKPYSPRELTARVRDVLDGPVSH
ncbi:MAG: PAS domain-containing protein [Vicinamibacterales bacterium]